MNEMTPSVAPAVGEQWTFYSAAQNLPAVLNDPNRGKQSNFFVRTWGDTFVEKTHIEKSPFLPEITYGHFDSYIKKIGKRYKRHTRLSQAKLETTNHIKTRNRNDLLLQQQQQNDIKGLDIIPEIFLRRNFPLNDPQVFAQVFRQKERIGDHAMQEELSQYLDIVEVQIAKQVAQKSGAFFHAMTSHDTIMEQMGVACQEVRALRAKVQKVDKTLAKDSLRLIGLARSRANHVRLFDKLKLMATVLQTQPTLQLLLSSSDYVAALELIAGTQEVLARELAGVTSLRHLPSQLKEMSKLIDKMLSTEFERYAAADLHRPLNSTEGVLEQERLVSLAAGLLRQNNLQFVETYKQEAVTAAQTLLKQLMIERLAEDEDDRTEHCLTGSGEVAIATSMDATDWLKVLTLASEALGKLIQRVKAVHDVIKETADVSAGLQNTGAATGGDSEGAFLSLEEHNRVEAKLNDLLISICDYCHERLASIVSTQSDKHSITATQVTELSHIVDSFTDLCEKICGGGGDGTSSSSSSSRHHQSAALRAAFKIQAGNYVQKFHAQRKHKLTLLLDAERWKSADVPHEIQILVDELALGKIIKSLPSSPSSGGEDDNHNLGDEDHHRRHTTTTKELTRKPSPALQVGAQHYVTVGTVLILIRLVTEYCVCAYDLQTLAPTIGRNLVELLRTFNSRSCQLVLGAGALRTAGLKTITSTNLALTSRSLQFVLWMMPHVRAHFQALINSDSSTTTTASLSSLMQSFDGVERDVGHHVQQLETKILSIMHALLGEQLGEWDAKPPVPSKTFRNVSRHLEKLHEAVSCVLPEEQVSDIYEIVHKNFKSRLREQLLRMNIQNNGGPQHGVVTTEIIFYLETMKKLKVLPEKYLSDKAMDDIWLR